MFKNWTIKALKEVYEFESLSQKGEKELVLYRQLREHSTQGQIGSLSARQYPKLKTLLIENVIVCSSQTMARHAKKHQSLCIMNSIIYKTYLYVSFHGFSNFRSLRSAFCILDHCNGKVSLLETYSLGSSKLELTRMYSNVVDKFVFCLELPHRTNTTTPKTDVTESIQRPNMLVVQVVNKFALIEELSSTNTA